MEYWEECIMEAFEDAGIVATSEQVNTVASWVEGAHENHGMATGHDMIPNPVATRAEEELRAIKAEAEKQRIWECETEPCKHCYTTGTRIDFWGRDQTCGWCGGKGRV